MRASVFVLCLIVAATAAARTITVDNDAPADFTTIQAAINDANDGDTIIVQPGVYAESVNFLGKNITLRSSNPTDWKTVKQTTINGMGHGPWPHDQAVIFRGTESDCMVSGFNINGRVIGVDLLFEYEPENRMHGTISYCLFQRNYVSAATVIEHCSGLISHCVVTNTRCSTLTPVSTVRDCHGLIENCTFADNPSSTSVDIKIRDGGELTVRNCIASMLVAGSSTRNVEYTNIDRLITGAGQFNLNIGPGNIYQDPCFVEHGYLDYNGTPLDANDDFWVDGDYHLKSQAGRWNANSQTWVQDDITSPCVDAGDPISPIGHEPFPNGGIINIGAYAGTPEASKSYFNAPTCQTIIAADINGDCKVDFKDFAIMALRWLEDNSPAHFKTLLKDGIEYSVETDRPAYRAGEHVQILFRVTNKTDDGVAFWFASSCQAAFEVVRGQALVWYDPVTVTWAETSASVAPRATREWTASWPAIDFNGSHDPSDSIPVAPGAYEIVVRFGCNYLFEDENYAIVRLPITVLP